MEELDGVKEGLVGLVVAESKRLGGNGGCNETSSPTSVGRWLCSSLCCPSCCSNVLLTLCAVDYPASATK